MNMQGLSGMENWRLLPNHKKGILGEKLAAQILMAQGFKLLIRNYRVGRYEIDIVAVKENELYGVEVKLRTNERYGEIEQYFSAQKLGQMKTAGNALLDRWPEYAAINLLLLHIRVSDDKAFYSIVDLLW